MSDEIKYIVNTVVLDAVLVIAVIVCYSPGLLNLRYYDSSILRSGLSIIIVPVAIYIFYLINKNLIYQKSVVSSGGKRVRVKTEDGDILDEIDRLNECIESGKILEKSELCRSCIADIFVRANDDDNDYTVPIVRSKIDYYLTVYIDTLNRMVTLEKYSNTSVYKHSKREISDTLDLLQEVFLKALDQMLSNTLNGADLDKIVLKSMMSMDGFDHNPFEALMNKYS